MTTAASFDVAPGLLYDGSAGERLYDVPQDATICRRTETPSVSRCMLIMEIMFQGKILTATGQPKDCLDLLGSWKIV